MKVAFISMQYYDDQDSNTYSQIIRNIEWGEKITKVDCINLIMRNLNSFLLDVKKKTI